MADEHARRTTHDNDADNPTVHTREVPNKKLDYHEKGTLPDGTPVGNLGALWYVLNSDEVAVSKGYHEIRPLGGGRYEGKIGAKREVFNVDSK